MVSDSELWMYISIASSKTPIHILHIVHSTGTRRIMIRSVITISTTSTSLRHPVLLLSYLWCEQAEDKGLKSSFEQTIIHTCLSVWYPWIKFFHLPHLPGQINMQRLSKEHQHQAEDGGAIEQRMRPRNMLWLHSCQLCNTLCPCLSCSALQGRNG